MRCKCCRSAGKRLTRPSEVVRQTGLRSRLLGTTCLGIRWHEIHSRPMSLQHDFHSIVLLYCRAQLLLLLLLLLSHFIIISINVFYFFILIIKLKLCVFYCFLLLLLLLSLLREQPPISALQTPRPGHWLVLFLVGCCHST